MSFLPERPGRSLVGSASPADAPRAAAGSRNSFLDAVRAVALIRIIVWHTYGYAWLSYLIASMPAMFFVAGSLIAQSLQRGSALDVLYRRFRRLLLPFWVFGAVALLVMSLEAGSFAAAGERLLWWIAPVWDPAATQWGLTLTVPLWYLRCLTWLLLASPALLWLWRKAGPQLLLVPLAGIFVLELWSSDLGLPWQARDVTLYGFFWLLGFAYHDGYFSRLATRARVSACLVAVAASALFLLTQDVPSGIVNRSYPLHLFVGLAWLFGALAVEGTIARIAARGRVAAVFAWMNGRALTIYLWQTAGLLTMYQLLWTSEHSAFTRAALALPIVVSVTFLGMVLFGWVEDAAARRGLPWGKGRRMPSLSLSLDRKRLDRKRLAGGVVASAGGLSILIAMAGVARDPSTLVQASAHTIPPSGAGLHYRAQNAKVTEAPPVVTISGRSDPVSSDELQSELEQWQQQWGIGGVSVSLRRESGETWSGAAGTDEYGNTFWADEPYWIASVTKTFTAALILRLADAGYFGLDDPVAKVIPEFPEAERFTIRHLLQHTSGLTSESEEPYLALAEAAQAGLQFEPGQGYLYSRAGYYLLGLIIEKVTGTSYTYALHQELLGPLELSSTIMDEEFYSVLPYSTHPYFPADPDNVEDSSWTQSGMYLQTTPGAWDYHGILWSAGGLWSTTSDLTRWALALWDSEQVISGVARQQMTSFLDDRFDFTGLATYPFCPCWRNNDVLHAERWGFAGTTGILEFDPTDRVALAVHVSGSLFDHDVIDALEDLSARLRRVVRAREILPQPPALIASEPELTTADPEASDAGAAVEAADSEASDSEPDASSDTEVEDADETVLGETDLEDLEQETDAPAAYTVEPGDTLLDIAAKLGIGEQDREAWAEDVRSLNGIDEDSSVDAGSELKLPE